MRVSWHPGVYSEAARKEVIQYVANSSQMRHSSERWRPVRTIADHTLRMCCGVGQNFSCLLKKSTKSEWTSENVTHIFLTRPGIKKNKGLSSGGRARGGSSTLWTWVELQPDVSHGATVWGIGSYWASHRVPHVWSVKSLDSVKNCSQINRSQGCSDVKTCFTLSSSKWAEYRKHQDEGRPVYPQKIACGDITNCRFQLELWGGHHPPICECEKEKHIGPKDTGTAQPLF